MELTILMVMGADLHTDIVTINEHLNLYLFSVIGSLH
jgi:hypothetical protein